MGKLKKVLIPMVALLALSVLVTSVSAQYLEYYTVRFHGHANGCCWVFDELSAGPEPPEPIGSGRGRFNINGFAIAQEGDPDFFWSRPMLDPNMHIRIHRARMRVSWGLETMMVHMWPSPEIFGSFEDSENTLYMENLAFYGYYIGDMGLAYIQGIAFVTVGFSGSPGEEVLGAVVMLFVGGEHFRTFVWVGEEVEGLPPGGLARSITHWVTVWPIPWLPSLY